MRSLLVQLEPASAARAVRVREARGVVLAQASLASQQNLEFVVLRLAPPCFGAPRRRARFSASVGVARTPDTFGGGGMRASVNVRIT